MKLARIRHSSEYEVDWTNWINTVEMREQWKNQKLHLHEALLRWGHHECQNVHDKVYELVGLAVETSLEIDLSMSIVDLFEEVLRVEKGKIHAHGYRCSRDCTARLRSILGLREDARAQQVEIGFVKRYKE